MFDFTRIARLYARIRMRSLDRADPRTVQLRALRSLVGRAQPTRFGRAHRFAEIREVAEFQARVPLRGYDEFWNDWWSDGHPVLDDVTWPGRIPFFALSSGTTTGASKRIPYTREMSRAARRGLRDLFAFHLQARPRSRIFGGGGLSLTGSTELEHPAAGVAEGAVSAITALGTPNWLRRRLLPDDATAALPDWREKIRRLAPLSLDCDVRMLAGSPSWLLLFLDEVAKARGDRPRRLSEWYPGLELIIHGGVNFEPYRAAFAALMEDGHAETREVYSASEGYFASADRGDGEGLRLHLDGECFYEFVPVGELADPAPRRLWVGDVEPGMECALVVSTAAGLWSYIVGDTVRVVSLSPPRIVVTGRLSQQLSSFGEHVIESEIADAVGRAVEAVGGEVRDYAVTSVHASEGRGGRHEFLVECAPTPADQAARTRFAEVLDARLSELNADYREHRARDFGMQPPKVRFARQGGFEAWMKRRRALGGQNKVPRIVTDPDLFADIVAIAEEGRTP